MAEKQPIAPLVPAGTDLTALEYMPLNVAQLLASDTWAIASGDEAKAAMTLWCYAWHQVPAGSVPADEKVLAVRSGAGSKWSKVRDVAMRGFVLCSDGRYYHRTICGQVLIAAEKRRHWRLKKRAQRGNVPSDVPGDTGGDESGTQAGHTGGNSVTGRDGTGHKTEKNHDSENHDAAARESSTGEFDAVPEVETADLRLRLNGQPTRGLQPIGSVFSTGKRRKAQDRADADMRRHLQNIAGMTAQHAAETVDAARDPEHPDHANARRLCEMHSRDHKLGWFPHDRDAA